MKASGAPAASMVAFAVFVAVAGVVPMIVIHELFHTGAARLLGDPEASFSLYRSGEAIYRDGSSGTCVGCNDVDVTALVSDWARLVVHAAGVIGTQITAVALGGVLARTASLGRRARVALATLAVLCVFDAPWQTWQGLGVQVTADTYPSHVDGADVIYLVDKIFSLGYRLAAGLIVAATLIWLAVVARFGLGLARSGARRARS